MSNAALFRRPALSIAAALAVFLANPLQAQNAHSPAPGDRWISASQVASDIALASEAYRRIHPGYTRYAEEAQLEAAWAAIAERAEMAGGMRLADLYLAVERVLTLIRCDHTKAELPTVMRQARERQPLYLPFRWQLVEGRGLIRLASGDSGIERGDEIIAVDGRPLTEIVDAVSPYIPVDGYTEWSRQGGISESLEFMGGGVDHFGMLIWDTPSLAVITLRDAQGQERRVEVPRISFEEWSRIPSELGVEGAAAVNFADAVHYTTLGENTGYLRVDTFVNYRNPVDPSAVFEPIFNALAQEGQTTLILDLRENGGGSTDAAQALATYLLEQAQPLKLSMTVATLEFGGLKEHLSTWDARALNPDPRGFIANDDGTFTLRDGIADDTAVLEPADAAFNGRLIVLTSNNNSSGSTNLLSILEQQERTTLVGEKTGGSAEGPNAGIQFTLTLPESGIRTRIPLFRFRNNVASFEPGLGLSPDVFAPMTVAAFRGGRDPALEAAIALAANEPAVVAPASPASVANIEDFAVLAGDGWIGTLEYLNYGSDERSTIPVRMIVQDPQGRSLRYSVIYPGEEDANSSERFRISRDGTQIDGFPIVERFSNPERGLVFVTQGSGRDDSRPADIRLTYEIRADRFVVSKEVRFADGDWLNRNSYNLAR